MNQKSDVSHGEAEMPLKHLIYEDWEYCTAFIEYFQS